MEVAVILFDQLTSLDFIGFYDGITRLKTLGYRSDVNWAYFDWLEYVGNI